MNLAEEETDSSEQRAKRSKRGASFPRMALSEAVSAVQEIAKMGRHHNQGSLASALGHASVKSGTFRQRLADLREYGLVGGRGDDLELTDLALRITRPTSSGDADAALGAAFRNCETFARMYDELDKGEVIPLDRLGNFSIHKLNVGHHVADRFAESFAAGAVMAQVAERNDSGLILWERERAGSSSSAEIPAGDAAPMPHNEPESSVPPAGTAEVLKQTWSLNNGEVRLSVSLTDALPSSAFGPAGEAVSAIEAFVQHLSECFPEDQQSSADEDEA